MIHLEKHFINRKRRVETAGIIKTRLRILRLTLRDFSTESGFHRPKVSEVVNCHQADPDIRRALCEYLNLNPADLGWEHVSPAPQGERAEPPIHVTS